jgi:hypothetical protein
MKRNLLTAGVVLVLTLLVLIGIVNVLAVPASETPKPDPSQLVLLPDGSERTIAELVAPWTEPGGDGREGGSSIVELEELVSGEPNAPDDRRTTDKTQEELEAEVAAVLEEWRRKRDQPPENNDPFDLAEWFRHSGDLDQAKALYLSMPENHPQWARSRRRLAWDVFAEEGDAGRGVPFVHESILAEPFDGNSWQDAARVYAATLGLPVN